MLTIVWAYRVQAHQTECEPRKDPSEKNQANDEGDIPPKQRGTQTHVYMRLAMYVLIFRRQVSITYEQRAKAYEL